MKETNAYEVNTKFNKDLIIQETGFSGSDRNSDMARNVIQLQKQGVREALIKLGWTTPEGSADLQAKNDELRASNERLKTALNLTLVDACNDYSCSEDFHDAMYEVLHETQAQSLADIRAEAVMSIIKSDLGFSHTVNDFESEWVYSEDDIKDHANRIKEG